MGFGIVLLFVLGICGMFILLNDVGIWFLIFVIVVGLKGIFLIGCGIVVLICSLDMIVWEIFVLIVFLLKLNLNFLKLRLFFVLIVGVDGIGFS